MPEISETFRPVTDAIDYNTEYSDPTLLFSTSHSTLYRVSKAGRYFIIKTAKDNSAFQLSMLKREYELSVGHMHPHIVNIITYESVTPVGPGIIMEYVDGRNLNEFLAEKPSVSTRQRIFRQIIDAVGYIHKNGIIHNDLKPENILISRINDDVKLIDFGLSDDDAHYMARTLGCTPKYASPELLAQTDDIDTRSDIYSIGLLLRDIFGKKYASISRRCLRNDRNSRYSNIEQLQQAFCHYHRPLYITAAIIVIATIISLIVLDRHYTPTPTATTVDTIKIIQPQAVETPQIASTTATTATTPPVNSRPNKTIAMDTYRKAYLDSVYNIFDTSMAQFYDRMLDTLSRVPYNDYELVYILNFQSNAFQLENRLLSTAPDETTAIHLRNHIFNTRSAYTDKVNEYECDKPSIRDALNQGLISEEEYRYHYNRCIVNLPQLPYEPYTPAQK